jgi:hypothetical protein
MRGLVTILMGSELTSAQVSTVLVACSCNVEHCMKILARVWKRFPKARFTYIAPKSYVRFLPEGANIDLVSEIKKNGVKKLREIRRRKFDVAVLMLTGQPVFGKIKLWMLLTDYRLLNVYNENFDVISCTGANLKYLLHHLKWRASEKGIPITPANLLRVLTFPLALAYLLSYTAWVTLRSRLRPAAHGEFQSPAVK